MGVLPLQFPPGITRKTLQLTGDEEIKVTGMDSIEPGMTLELTVTKADGSSQNCQLQCRLDTALEVSYYTSSGIMPHVVNKLTNSHS